MYAMHGSSLNGVPPIPRPWQDATRLDKAGRPCNRVALMIRWLEQNQYWIEHFEFGAVELHFNGTNIVGKLAKATLDKPDS